MRPHRVKMKPSPTSRPRANENLRHDKGAVLVKARADNKGNDVPVTLNYPSGKSHVLLPTGQQINPNKAHESKKERLRRRRAGPIVTPVPLLVNQAE